MHFLVGIVCVFSATDLSLCFSPLVSLLRYWGYNIKPIRQDAVFGPLLITSTLVNLVMGVIFIVSDFVVTVFPRGTAKFVSVPKLTTARELEREINPKFLLRKTTVSPAQVSGNIGSMSPEISESFTVKQQVEAGCIDHNHDMVDQNFVCGPRLRGTNDQGGETQWKGNLKQNLDRSAVALPVEETIRVKRISKARKVPLIYSSHGQSAREKDDTFW